ncbi:MAG: leucine-rich repeat domain-containing protein [Lachnospiraceae bacterium]|nr:leucine-rich repeat domain-containing protein [Lachnospiraceae bacterium]
MGLTEKLTNIKTEAEALLAFANSKTGASDTSLGDAVARLAGGYGQGGGISLDALSMYMIDGLTEIYSPTITKIQRMYAFAQMHSVTSINLPNVTFIGAYAFFGDKYVTSVNLPKVDAIEYQAFRGCAKIEEIVLPSYNSRFDTSTFEACDSLRKIDANRIYFSTGVSLKNYSLSCKNLETLIIRNTDKIATLESRNVFGTATYKMNSGQGYIYVPSSLVDTYKANATWSTYVDQIRAIEDYPEICG